MREAKHYKSMYGDDYNDLYNVTDDEAVYADYEVLVASNGKIVAALTEPEDRTFGRDLRPVVDELNMLKDQFGLVKQENMEYLHCIEELSKALKTLMEDTGREFRPWYHVHCEWSWHKAREALKNARRITEGEDDE